MSGVYVQAFNEAFGTNDRAVYICDPKGDENEDGARRTDSNIRWLYSFMDTGQLATLSGYLEGPEQLYRAKHRYSQHEWHLYKS